MGKLLPIGFVLLAASSILAACASNESTTCDTIALPGIVLQVSTSDGADLATVPGLVIEVRDGDYLERETTSSFAFAIERPGTYVVTVTHPCYETWSRDGVVVDGGECHVRMNVIDVALQSRACDVATPAPDVASETGSD